MKSSSMAIRLVALLLLLPAASPYLRGQESRQELPEYVVKAGFFYNFAKYVEWPESAFEDDRSPIRIGIVGKDPFGETLDKVLREKSVLERKFTITRFKDPGEIKGCHILFVPRTENDRLPKILEQVKESGVLTVGEEAAFARSGGIINILIEEKKPKLEINPDAASAQKITINSKLLKVARIVKTEK